MRYAHASSAAAAMTQIDDFRAGVQRGFDGRVGMGGLLDDAVVVAAVHQVEAQREILPAVPVQIAA